MFACPYAYIQVWSFTAAMAHMRTCMEIAAKAAAEGKRYSAFMIQLSVHSIMRVCYLYRGTA